MTEGPGPPLLEFLEVMRRLQVECPWKAEQTHETLGKYLVEETQEVLEAIDSGDDDNLCEELGDLLLQVYFHAIYAEQRGAFTIDDAPGASPGGARRNPHLFGGPEAGTRTWTAAEVDARSGSASSRWRRSGASRID